jgi:hypothetical protein
MSKTARAASNLAMLEFVARKLGKLKDQFIFLGGCTTALFITDPAAPDIRSTIDVDCIVDVASLVQYHKIERTLQKLGFKKSLVEEVICRWYYDDAILDVMPTDEKILGFSNYWYHIIANSQFHVALPGHLNYGSLTTERAEIVLSRIENLINSGSLK